MTSPQPMGIERKAKAIALRILSGGFLKTSDTFMDNRWSFSNDVRNVHKILIPAPKASTARSTDSISVSRTAFMGYRFAPTF